MGQSMIHRFLTKFLCLTLFTTLSAVYADTIKIPLSGSGTVRSSNTLSVAPPLLDSGDVAIGKSSVQRFEITHIGASDDAAVEIYSIEVGGEDSFDYLTNSFGYTSLSSTETVGFDVTFSPVTLGVKKAFLRIEHSGANSPHLVLLTGVGIDIPASKLDISVTTIDFGTVPTDVSKSQSFILTNVGGNNYPPVTLYNIVLTGDNADSFTTDFNNVVSLEPGKSVTVKVTTNSGIAGNKVAQLSVEHDGSNPPIKVALTAKQEIAQVTNPDGPAIEPVFAQSTLKKAAPKKPSSLQFGPDGNLYVSSRDGDIYVYTVNRAGKNNYTTTKQETITLVQKITNHNDDGSVNKAVKGRLVTGLLVVGTTNNPVIYVSSGDPRMGAGPSGNDSNLDTNSVIVSRLTKNGNNWNKVDLVRGLPRSEENHQGNGMQLSKDGKTLYLAVGGNTNMGLPSNNFARIPEYAYSAAIVEINLQQIGNTTYDLPTLNDEDRAGPDDANDPFGGNNGKNMAILENNGPVKIYAPGFRNAYDVLLTTAGKMYTIDNGPNAGWGAPPPGNCLGNYKDGGTTYKDSLHYITGKGYYGGHPNPTRGSKNNKFNDSNPQSPIQGNANAVECQYKVPGKSNNSLHVFNASTNGFTEYRASNFGGSMQGDLLAGSFDRSVYRIQLNNAGTKLNGIDKLFQKLGTPLDVTAQGDQDIFPGTIWVADYAVNAILVFEPEDYK
ncbi:hypothetical protein AB833_14690 [Chromatiales bacterium (ex Bugula neritina AB1)]|nr:hypothetical protein AB833_14690 [Chromatiales bacterium (ex Bugula neritina AB1)]